MNEKRFDEMYEYLVDETENPITCRDRYKSRTRSLLLSVFEYLQNNSDENPLPEIFEE